jgi:predicted transposase YbfD/YdcC
MGVFFDQLHKNFDGVTEPRQTNKRHKLFDILAIALCGTICGCEGWEDFEEFGEAKQDWLRQFLELPHGIPSNDTFARVFSMLNPSEFQQSFINWVKDLQDLTGGKLVAIDGKTVRHSFDHKAGVKPLHMVSAWAVNNRMLLGQIKTADKSNEITAIPELLKMLDIEGAIVTIDAMGCQKKIAEQIIGQGADYVLSLKGNHSNLHDDVVQFMTDARAGHFSDVHLEHYKSVDGEHGRIEVRDYWCCTDVSWLEDGLKWKNLNSLIMVERQREIDSVTSTEVSFYISSLKGDMVVTANAIRGHWGIENSLHWTLDMTFREDDSRIRKDHAAENMAVVRHMALNMLQKENSKKRSIKKKRLRAGFDNDFLGSILNA